MRTLSVFAALFVTNLAFAGDDSTEATDDQCDSDYGCVTTVDADGNATTTCGELVDGEPSGEKQYDAQDCINDGGTICTYPNFPGEIYCCNVFQGAPPRL